MPNLKKNFRESIFVAPKIIPLAGRRRRIFYTAKKDRPSSFETICELANRAQATLMVMKNGEHRFCAAEQMRFLGNLDTALYLTSASGRNLNFKAAVCAEYF